jgi:hypothetical protein
VLRVRGAVLNLTMCAKLLEHGRSILFSRGTATSDFKELLPSFTT